MLLLDEPTNHLDIQMREALIFALQEYNGAVILVSHDRYFVNSVVDHLWLVADGRVNEFKGNLDDYQAMVLADEEPVKVAQVQQVAAKPKKVKASNANPQHIKKLEKDIAELQKKQLVLDKRLADSDIYLPENANLLKEVQANADKVRVELQTLEELWLKLVADSS